MFNPPLQQNYSSNQRQLTQQQGYSSNQQYNTTNAQNQSPLHSSGGRQNSGGNQQQYNSQLRNSQLNASNADYKISNMLHRNQNQNLNNSLNQSTLHDKKVLNKNLQQMLATNKMQKQQQNSQRSNNTQVIKESNNLNNTNTQGNQLNQSLNTTALKKEHMKTQLKDQKTFGYCLRWCHLIFVFLYSVAAVVVSSILVYYFPSNTSNRQQMQLTIDNWNKPMISDIKVITLTAQDITNQNFPPCPNTYQNFFTLYGLPIVDGCNCISSTYATKTIMVGKCSTLQTQSGCANVSGFDPPQGLNWMTPDLQTYFTICVQTITGLTYSAVGSTTSCVKTCGGNTVDTQICVDANQACPINYLYFGLPNDPGMTLSTASSIAVGSYKLFYSTQGTGAPIVEVRVTKGLGVCLDNNVQNLPQATSYYPLLNTNITEVCTTSSNLDSRFTKLMSLTESDAYTANFFKGKYTGLPNYSVSTTDLYSIYTRPIVNLVASVRSTDITTFQNSNSNFSMVNQASISVLVTSIIYLICVGIVYNSLSILNILNKKYLFKQYLYEVNPIEEPEQKSTLFKKLWLKILITLVQMISILVAFVITLQNYFYLTNLSSGTAIGDTYTVNLVNSLQSEYQTKILWYIVSNFIWFSVIVILELFVLVPLCSKKIQEKQKVEISEKYMPKPGSSKAEHQQKQSAANQNKGGVELPEYQTHNVYGGNGINTTINPFMQQVSVLGADVMVTSNNNRSIHMGPGLYNVPQRENKTGGHSRNNTYLNNSTINQSILPPEIKHYESQHYNKSQYQSEYKAPANANNYNQQEQSEVQRKQNNNYNSSSQRGGFGGGNENLTAGSQSALPTAPNHSDANKNAQGRVNDNNNIESQYKSNSAQSNYFSNYNSRNPNQQYQERNFQQQNQFGDETIDLDFQSNQYVHQHPVGGGVDNIDFGMQSSIGGEYKKKQQNPTKYSIETLPNQGNNNNYRNDYGIGGNIQPIPEVDSHRQQFGQDRSSNQDYKTNQYNNYTIKSTGKLDQQQNNFSNNQLPSSNPYSNNALGSYNNINRNIVDEDNNYSKSMNENNNNANENKVQRVKNTEFNANQEHNPYQNYDDYTSFRETGNRTQTSNRTKNNYNSNPNNQINNNQNNNNNNNNNFNIYNSNKNTNNPQINQQIFQAQNRIYDKNDQDVDDPDMYDINLPAYNQKFY